MPIHDYVPHKQIAHATKGEAGITLNPLTCREVAGMGGVRCPGVGRLLKAEVHSQAEWLAGDQSTASPFLDPPVLPNLLGGECR